MKSLLSPTEALLILVAISLCVALPGGQKNLNVRDLLDALLVASKEKDQPPLLDSSIDNPAVVNPSRRFQRQIYPGTPSLECDAAEGTILMSFPEKCMQLTCRNRKLTPVYVYDEGLCNCCEHDGKLYKEGDELPGVCEKMFCCDGEWVSTGVINDCCDHCEVFGDPHVISFDAPPNPINWYSFYSLCNYTVTQKLEGKQGSNNPEFAIYVMFSSNCWQLGGTTSCVDAVTFVDNKHTVIQIMMFDFQTTWVNGHPIYSNSTTPTFLVDGQGHQHPVMMWNVHNGCKRLLGSQGIMIHLCPYYMHVFAHESLYGEIGGLCGYFNGYDQDDRMTRNGTIKELTFYPVEPAPDFIFSWLAPGTNQDYCKQEPLNPLGAPNPFGITEFGENVITYKRMSPYFAPIPTSHGVCYDQNVTTRYYAQCYELIHNYYHNPGLENLHHNYIAACLHDLCVIGDAGVTLIIDTYNMMYNDRMMMEMYYEDSGNTNFNPCPAKPTTSPFDTTVTVTSIYTTTICPTSTFYTTPIYTSTTWPYYRTTTPPSEYDYYTSTDYDYDTSYESVAKHQKNRKNKS